SPPTPTLALCAPLKASTSAGTERPAANIRAMPSVRARRAGLLGPFGLLTSAGARAPWGPRIAMKNTPRPSRAQTRTMAMTIARGRYRVRLAKGRPRHPPTAARTRRNTATCSCGRGYAPKLDSGDGDPRGRPAAERRDWLTCWLLVFDRVYREALA